MTEQMLLDNSRKFYDWVLVKQRTDFFANAANFQHLINLASSLFHFHEWLFADYGSQLHVELGATRPFSNPGQFWGAVQSTNSKFGFIRDIANASKHVQLTRNPSTSMSHMANTSIQVASYDSSQWDNAKWDEPYAASKDGPIDVPFDTCAEELFDYWTLLIDKLSPQGSP
jgi:hypothetical protein